MRKSLGEKRKEISDEQIAEITRLYAEFAEGERTKILPNESFGFMRITVERPFRKLGPLNTLREVLLRAPEWEQFTSPESDGSGARHELIERLLGEVETLWLSGEKVRSQLVNAISETNAQAPLLRAIIRELDKATERGEIRDEVVIVKKGRNKGDPDLRDNENVPLPTVAVAWQSDLVERLESSTYRAAIDEYVSAEVSPYVPDAWVDNEKTKIGYEIPLTRYFYKYVPPRPLAEIDAEIKALEAEIQVLLGEVTE